MYVQRKSLVSAVCACTVLLSFTCGVLLDCKCTSLTAHADSLDPVFMAQQADNYFDQVEQQIVTIENAVLTDIKNGTVSATSALGKQYMQAVALQMACIYSPTFQSVYHASQLVMQGLPDDIFDNPSEISVGVSGGSFLYYNYENELRSCFCSLTDSISSSGTHVLVYAPDFKIYFTSTGESSATYSFEYYNGASWESVDRCGLGFNAIYSGAVTEYIEYPNGQFNNMSLSYNAPASMNNTYIISRSSIPQVTNFNSFSNITIGGLGGVVSAPADNIESDRPYDYYNNVVLPYIHNNLPDIPEEYIIFPDGWTPGQLPTDPPEPTSPTGDYILPPYGELMTEPSSWFVTDESGETITDESGEPVTETTMIPVTVASSEEGRYVFRIPTLPNLDVPAETPELSLSLPQKLVGLSASLFRGVYEILDSSGVLTILPFLVAVAVAIYVIYHIGG